MILNIFVLESVKNLLGKQIKILLKNVVKLETKNDRTENRVLVFSPCRLFLLTAKVPTRVSCRFSDEKNLDDYKKNDFIIIKIIIIITD